MSVKIPILTDYDARGVKKAEASLNNLQKVGEAAGNSLRAALIPASLAVGAFSAVLVSSVKAAMDDAAAQQQLAGVLKRTTAATADNVRQAEQFISSLSKQTATADDELRPALARLVMATHDQAAAQKLLVVSQDVAAASGKDLDTVTAALSKAYNGNYKALKMLDPSLNAVIKTGASFTDTMKVLAQTTGGAAVDAANSAAGRMKALHIAIGETKETIGAAFLPVVQKLSGELTGWLNKTENQEKLQKAVNETVRVAGQVFAFLWPHIKRAAEFASKLSDNLGGVDKAFELILGGLLVKKVIGLADSIGGPKGLAGGLFKATESITGSGGLLAALRLIPSVVTISLVISAVIPKSLKTLGQDTLSAAGLGGLGNLPLIGSLAQGATGVGRNLGEKIGIKSIDTGGYTSGSSEHAYYMAGLQSIAPPGGKLGSGSDTAAYAAGRRKAGTQSAYNAPTVAVNANSSRTLPGFNANDYSSFGGATSSGGGGGSGKTAKSSFINEDPIAGMAKAQKIWDKLVATIMRAKANADALTAQRVDIISTRMSQFNQFGPLSGFNAESIAADKDRVKAAAEKLKAASEDASRIVGSAFATVAAKSMKAFTAQTAAGLEQMAASFNTQVTGIRSRLAVQLASVNAALAATMSALDKQEGALTPAEQALAAAEATRSQALAARTLAGAETQLAAARLAGDQADIVAAELALADVRENQAIDALQVMARDEREAARERFKLARQTAQDLAAEQQQSYQTAAQAEEVAAQNSYNAAAMNYQAERDLQEEHLSLELEALKTSLEQQPKAWSTIHDKVMSLFSDSFGPDYKTAGTNMGSAFVTGLLESFGKVGAAAIAATPSLTTAQTAVVSPAATITAAKPAAQTVINVNGVLTEANAGQAIVNALRRFNQVTGPINIKVA
ncbi:hypothetical protein UFOVP1208_1 [uncultured Caudovirales phage]|uniref:Uncharacterized protein n=3 Tax=uncultured Caudovirales phage TaxID=2100421 RepID=A0A6J5RI76_9CAUD|nr:hypothetical protein UFOVP1208_1 [uncultured Caudovirales phage]CAB4194066.1 hypothetical protein UFOVP1263_10 [uncultured Caudovirales phage]